MKNFEYAEPRTESEMLDLLSPELDATVLLAGGTDLVPLMKKMIVTPNRVVNIGQVGSIRQIEPDPSGGVRIGAAVNLDTFLDSPLTDAYPAIKQAIQGISSIQHQAQSTIGGELLRRPACWYFRSGHGLLAKDGRLVDEGDNRYHAILGNHGPAKFVNASRLAPPLISLAAQIRVIGPGTEDEQLLRLEDLYCTPRHESQRENMLQPNQVLTHVILPPDEGRLSAAYEVRHGEGPDPPLAAAAATMRVVGGIVQDAKVAIGHVAPVPWVSADAARALLAQPISQQTAEFAGLEAVARATPLSNNGYKVQLAQVAVERAVLRAAGLDTGGF